MKTGIAMICGGIFILFLAGAAIGAGAEVRSFGGPAIFLIVGGIARMIYASRAKADQAADEAKSLAASNSAATAAFCEKCGAAFDGSAKFCEKCGATRAGG